MKIKNCLIFISLLLVIVATGTSASGKDAVVIRGESEEIVHAFPVLDNTVLRFEDDTLIIRKDGWEHRVASHNVARLDHTDEFGSSIRVTVLTNDSVKSPIEGIYVKLHNIYNDEICGEVRTTDENGVALFLNIPTGYYNFFVAQSDPDFEPAIGAFIHGYEAETEVTLTEKVWSQEETFYIIEEIY